MHMSSRNKKRLRFLNHEVFVNEEKIFEKWRAEWENYSELRRQLSIEGIEAEIWRDWCAPMARTQAALIAGVASAPVIGMLICRTGDAPESVASNRYQAYLRECKNQALTGRIEVTVPDWLIEHFRKEKMKCSGRYPS